MFRITVPPSKSRTETKIAHIDGKKVVVPVPEKMQHGGSFVYKYYDASRVYASTTPTIPGMEIVQTKPIIFSTASDAFQSAEHGIQPVQLVGRQVGSLVQEAQAEALRRAAKIRCNAVLSMNFGVSTNDSGPASKRTVIVTATGTPAVVVPAARAPVVQVDAIVEPLYYFNREEIAEPPQYFDHEEIRM